MKISEHLSTKTPSQVGSHDQKHFLHHSATSKKTKRKSNFDITSLNGDSNPLLYKDNIPFPPPLPTSWDDPLLYKDRYVPALPSPPPN